MKRLISITVIVLALNGVYGSCKKINVPNYPVDADLKAAFAFKPGTYWIYKDSLSGQIDSFFVRQLTTNYSISQPNVSYTTDNTFTNITEFNVTSNIDSNVWEFGLSQNCMYVSYDVSARYTNGINYIPDIYPFTISVNLGDTINVISTFSLLNNYFENVALVHHSSTDPQYSDYLYLCPNIGMVKIVLNHAYDSTKRVWELQRWNIVQ